MERKEERIITHICHLIYIRCKRCDKWHCGWRHKSAKIII